MKLSFPRHLPILPTRTTRAQRPPRQRQPRRKQRGFGLVEMMLTMGATAGVVFALIYTTQQTYLDRNQVDSQALLELADRQTLQFLARNQRLPCPDTDRDGFENCESDAAKGFLPYRSLGMASLVYTAGDVPLLYGVYRNHNRLFLEHIADLTQRSVIFHPTNSDGTSFHFEGILHENNLDFCLTLSALANAPSHLHPGHPDFLPLFAQDPSGEREHIAFAIAHPGTRNADGAGEGILALYDGLNRSHPSGFVSPDTPVGPDYDDNTLVRGFVELEGILTCDIVRRSLNLMADTLATQKENWDFAESNYELAVLGVINAVIAALLAAKNLRASINGFSSNALLITQITAALAAATASCVALPIGPGCIVAALYTTALVTAKAAQVAWGVAIALSATTVAASLAQVGYSSYVVDVARRYNPTAPTPEFPPPPDQDALANEQQQVETQRNETRLALDAALAALVPYREAEADAQLRWEEQQAQLETILADLGGRVAEVIPPWEARLGEFSGDPLAPEQPPVDPAEVAMITALEAHFAAQLTILELEAMIAFSIAPCSSGEITTLDGETQPLTAAEQANYCTLLNEAETALSTSESTRDQALAQAEAQRQQLHAGSATHTGTTQLDAYDQALSAYQADPSAANATALDSAAAALVPPLTPRDESGVALCDPSPCNLAVALDAFYADYRTWNEAHLELIRQEQQQQIESLEAEIEALESHLQALECAKQGLFPAEGGGCSATLPPTELPPDFEEVEPPDLNCPSGVVTPSCIPPDLEGIPKMYNYGETILRQADERGTGR